MNELKKKFRIGLVLKFKTTLRSGKEEELFGKVTKCIYDEEYNCYRYCLEEYPEKSEFTWVIPEQKLQSVTLMEM